MKRMVSQLQKTCYPTYFHTVRLLVYEPLKIVVYWPKPLFLQNNSTWFKNFTQTFCHKSCKVYKESCNLNVCQQLTWIPAEALMGVQGRPKSNIYDLFFFNSVIHKIKTNSDSCVSRFMPYPITSNVCCYWTHFSMKLLLSNKQLESQDLCNILVVCNIVKTCI